MSTTLSLLNGPNYYKPLNSNHTPIIKAKEAEDIPFYKSSVYKEWSSEYSLKPERVQKSEKDEITARCGEIWECVSRKPNKFGGYIYAFKMKNEYYNRENHNVNFDALNKKADEIFPANELLNPEGLKFYDIHKKVGFAQVENVLYLPDREALMANWEQLRQEDPDLPPLDILSAEGISDDKEYVEAYFMHDVLLSSGKEFFHDCVLHVGPTLAQMARLKNGTPETGKLSFKKEKTRIVKMVAKFYRTLAIARLHMNEETRVKFEKEKILEKMELMLGYVVDSFSSSSHTENFDETWIQNTFENIWDNPPPRMRCFLKRRLGHEKMSQIPFSSIWKQLKEIEAQFDSTDPSRQPGKKTFCFHDFWRMKISLLTKILSVYFPLNPLAFITERVISIVDRFLYKPCSVT